MTPLQSLKTRVVVDVLQTPRRVVGPRISAMFARNNLPRRLDFAALRPQTRILIKSLACLTGAIVLVTAGTIASIEMSATRMPHWLGQQAKVTAVHPAEAGGGNVATRPLFSRHRQNALPAPVTPVAPPPPPLPIALDRNLVLKGVFMNDAFAKAFLTSSQNPLGMWVQAHDEISGWRVVKVQPDRVTLESQGDTLLVQLSINGRTP